ncbi:MAG: linear amide C-N hydrolase [Bacteroidetes bacterium]|nr:linear amide C-N hydrolase [Bacteroidota bacterium]
MIKVRFIFLALILHLGSYGLFAQSYEYSEDNNGLRTFRDGKLIIEEGIPFLTVKGNSYEMGLQYGVLMNEELLRMDHTVDSLIESYIGSFFMKKWISGIILNSNIRKIEKTMPHEYLQELQGMAEGSELELKDLQIIFYFPQLFFKISCTSFLFRDEEQMVHGRNLDWSGIESITHYPLIVNYHKTNKQPITVLTFVGYPGAYTGMNHSGLSMSINMNGAPAENHKKISDYNTGMPLAFKVRNVLENATTMQEVDELFDDYSSHAWFIIAGSRTDHSGAIYELTRGQVIKNPMSGDFQFIENLSISDVGRYAFSPVRMHENFNIARERKIKELYDRFSKKSDLVAKSYEILSNTEYYHLKHDPFYSNSINNSATVISCIMDNADNNLYFSYDERLAGLNKYLKYDIDAEEVTVYREKQEIPDQDYLDERLKYRDWYSSTISDKRKVDNEEYQLIIDKIGTLKLEPAYKFWLLSHYYSKLGNHEKAFENAQNYIAERPDYYHAYYNKYQTEKNRESYLDAIVALEEMMQTSTITPYYYYLAKIKMIELYDQLLDHQKDQIYIEKIHRLAKEIKSELNQYFIDKETQNDLKLIESIIEKYDN